MDPGRVVTGDVISRMTDALKHRGPDDRGIYESSWGRDYTGGYSPE